MSYRHILVAIDLTLESKLLIDKAIRLADSVGAELSFIHVDSSFGEDFTGQLLDDEDIMKKVQKPKDLQHKLKQLADNANYPIKHTLVGSNVFIDELENAVKSYDVDLVVCGHHHSHNDFWHDFASAAKQLFKEISVDMLVIPLH